MVLSQTVASFLALKGSNGLPGSQLVTYPHIALAATEYGDPRYRFPGPDRPGKLRFCEDIDTWSGEFVTPGPAAMHAPHPGSMNSAPIRSNRSR